MTVIEFTADDLARTRVGTCYGPYAEAMFSLGVVTGEPGHGVLFAGWRDQLVRPAAGRAAGVTAGPLRQLIGGNPPRLDLFTLIGRVGSVSEGRQALLGVDRRHLRAEIEAAPNCRASQRRDGITKIPGWAFDLAGDTAVRSRFADLKDAYTARALKSVWTHIWAYLATETAANARLLAHGGVEHLLNNAHPGMRWRGGVLEIDHSDSPGHHLRLNGRGLVLVPSVFCRRITIYIGLADPDGPAVMFYPALRDLTDAYRLWSRTQPESTRKALAALLGATRASALEAIGHGCTTSGLADQLGVSPPTASYHIAVLRDAGLVITRRRGSTVVHTASPLGTALLNGEKHPRKSG
jgi:DNA-binding transcriptional ArsR family regulator